MSGLASGFPNSESMHCLSHQVFKGQMVHPMPAELSVSQHLTQNEFDQWEEHPSMLWLYPCPGQFHNLNGMQERTEIPPERGDHTSLILLSH